jgi:hypothetical protein
VGGKTLKRATQTGLLLGTSGVISGLTTSAGVSGALSDETGSGALVFGTSPAITTSLTTPSTTFALVNTTATTVNFAGAATTLNVGAAATMVLNLGGSTSAAELRFLEPSGSGVNYTAFKVAAQAGNITYTLPVTVGGAGTFLRDAAGDGTLSWATPGGSGTVTVVGAGSLTSTALVTGGGTTTLQTPAATATMDASGNILTPGSVSTGVGGSIAGSFTSTEGTAPSLTANAFSIYSPADVAAGGLAYVLPAAAATGVLLATNSSGVMTISHNATTGTGNVVFSASPTLTGTIAAASQTLSGSLTVAGGAITNNVVQNSQSAAYTTVLADAGKQILHPTADNNARTFTIDSNANVAYPVGTCITFINQINTVTIAITSDTLVLAGAGTTGSRTLAANGIATAIKITSTIWLINGTGLTFIIFVRRRRRLEDLG